jgi:radical SAM protein with 4Fe4S-binding SPASM domain
MFNRDVSRLRGIYGAFLRDKKFPAPRIIHVETRSKCNGVCDFCPASALSDARPDVRMPPELVNTVLSQLRQADYSNRLSFYNNNEPLCDERIFSFISAARNALPKAYLELKTNGIAIDADIVVALFNAGLDMLYVNYYCGSGKVPGNIRRLKEDLSKLRRFKGHLDGSRYFSRIKFNKRYPHSIAGSRAGNSPNKKLESAPLKRLCIRPFEMMTISPRGDVSVCSEDFHYALRMGDLSSGTLFGLWNSPQWNDLRLRLLDGNRCSSATCAACDYRGFSYEILKENGLRSTIALMELKNSVKRVLRWHSLEGT